MGFETGPNAEIQQYLFVLNPQSNAPKPPILQPMIEGFSSLMG